MRNLDYILLDFDSRDFWLLAAMKLLCPWTRVKLVTLDLLLTRPRNLRDRLSLPLKRLLLSRAHRFIVFQRDTLGYELVYNIPPERFHHIPYKVNALDLIRQTPSEDRGYIFCGGQSRRDFRTLIRATEPLGCPTRIVTAGNYVLAGHGSYIAERDLPPHVTVVRLDGTPKRFVQEMAGARLVVIPIQRGVITQSGIAVCLQAMAMGKCVIASYGPGISDVLPAGSAIIVPPGDPDALREAIATVCRDDTLRLRIAEAGVEYANRLQGTDRLLRDTVTWVLADYGVHSQLAPWTDWGVKT